MLFTLMITARVSPEGSVMKQFINTKESLVTDAIDGAILASNGKLARLDGYPHIKVVVRTDWDRSKVALVSGGGSGHEPAHAGFVGKGMLTAAVCGDVFASPSVDAVLAGILAVTGPAGCLLIVKNYTGDRLNFGLAAERARAFGLNVSMVIVDDDVALPNLPRARGVAGTLFVHKIAGAMAEQGADLDSITSAAVEVIDGAISIGMSLDTCSIPGSPKEDRIPDGQAELGLGIHGEAGVEQVVFKGARQAMELMVERLAPRMSQGSHVALINNLGSATPLEMSVLTNELLKSRIGSHISHIIGPAPMMTSLDMHGFSISLLPVRTHALASLQATSAPWAWPGCHKVSDIKVVPLPDGLTPIQPMPSKNSKAEALIRRCCEILISAESELNALDAKSGDGDTGSTLATASRALVKALDRLPLADWTQLYRAIGLELSQTMGGSSGVLLAIFFTAAGDASANGHDPINALKAGLLRIQEVGGASIGDRTMIDALSPALDALPTSLEAAAKAARLGADGTSKMLRAKAGRASYVSESHLAGHNDPGAQAVALLFEQLFNNVGTLR
jgi:triose/dihydroxyacetone kinase / FAD-AMP lyase (cyclizing)